MTLITKYFILNIVHKIAEKQQKLDTLTLRSNHSLQQLL